MVFDTEPDLEVEVYNPKAGEALRLATSGDMERLVRSTLVSTIYGASEIQHGITAKTLGL